MGTLYPPDSIHRPVGKATHGELVLSNVLGTTRYQITSTTTTVWGVWVGAPTANNTVGSTNTSEIFIQISDADPGAVLVKSGGFHLAKDDYKGFIIPVNNAEALWFGGNTAGDVVEYSYLVLA